MEEMELQKIVDRLHLDGWTFVRRWGMDVKVEKLNVMNSRRANVGLGGGFSTSFNATSMTEAQVVKKCFAAVQYLSDHELREFYSYDGYLPFDPHGGYRSDGQGFYLDRMQGVRAEPDLSRSMQSYVGGRHGAPITRPELHPNFAPTSLAVGDDTSLREARSEPTVS